MTTSEVDSSLSEFQTLIMASMSPEGIPHASTAPYVRLENNFYILISTVAQHGRNLLTNQNISLLFAEDESKCVQPFARKRVTIEATSSEILQDDERYLAIIEALQSKFDSELIGSLSQMGDFHLFRLSAQSGSVVLS